MVDSARAEEKDEAATLDRIEVTADHADYARPTIGHIWADGARSGWALIDRMQGRLGFGRAAPTPADNEQSSEALQGDCGPSDVTGQPVVLASGNKLLAHTDLSAGISSLGITRRYSKMSQTASGFGPGWSWDWGLILSFEANPGFSPVCQPGTFEPGVPCPLVGSRYNAIVATRADGTRHRYTWNAGTGRFEDARPQSTSWIDASFWSDVTMDEFTLTGEDRSREIYNHIGRVLTAFDARNVGYTFVYTNLGNQLLEIRHTSGRKLVLGWTSGRITSVTAPNNQVFQYGYSNGRLRTVTYPDGLGTITYHHGDASQPDAVTGYSINGQRRTHYGYYADGRVEFSGLWGGSGRETISYHGSETRVSNPRGHVTAYHFEPNQGIQRLTRIENPSSAACPGGAVRTEYDQRGYPLRRTDAEGNQTTFQFNDRGQMTRRDTGIGPAPGNSTAERERTEYHWDVARNLMLRETRFGRASTPQSETLFVYHPDADTLRARLLQRVEVCRPTCANHVARRVTTYTYQFHPNRLPSQIVVDGPLPGTQDTTTYQFSATGDLTAVTNALGHQTSFSQHSALGLPGRTVDANGLVTRIEYDARGRETRRTVEASTGNLVYQTAWNADDQVAATVDPAGHQRRYVYDAVGRLVRVEENSPVAWGTGSQDQLRITYNNLNRVSERQLGHLANGSFTTLARTRLYYDDAGYLERELGNHGQERLFQYNRNGQLAGVQAGGQRTTTYLHDFHGRLKRQTDPIGGVTLMGYDSLGRLSQVTDPRGNATVYTYNAFGELTALASPDTGTQTFTYDVAGRPLTMTRSNGLTTSYTHDPLGRVTAISAQRPGGADVRSFVYDTCGFGVGRLCRITDPWGEHTYTYTRRGDIATQGTDVGGTNYVHVYDYDNRARVRQINLPGNGWVRYSYDAASRPSRVETMMNGSAWQDAASNIRWRPLGAGLHSLTYGNGHTLERSHDTSGRLTRVRVPGVLDNQLSYNAFDEITAIQRGFTPSLASQSYGYDDLGRLTTVGGNLPASFAYDANGNRTRHQIATGASLYSVAPDSNRLLETDGFGILRAQSASSAREYTLDVLGNQTSVRTLSTTTHYDYDGFNRLSRVSRSSDALNCMGTGECITLPAGETEYGYNGLGQRISKREFNASGQQTALWRYGYLPGGQLSFETNPDNPGVPRYYIWLGSQLIGLMHEGERFAVHTDHLGRPEAVTNAAGTRVWHAENHAFERRVLSSSLPRGLNIGFPGQYWDAESGLFYNHFRTYDPHTGRYTQSDPIGLAGGVNTYGYVSGNPLSYFDVHGLARDTVTARIESAIARGDVRQLQTLVESGALTPSQSRLAAEGLRSAQVMARTSNSTRQVAREIGRSEKEVRAAIEQCKQAGLPRNGPRRNPDVRVDPKTGEVFPEIGRGRVGDSIGNIFDYLPGGG
ncbi:MAG: RHS repeat-associated core domain-containing protein [Lysobacteraceae bacterium]